MGHQIPSDQSSRQLLSVYSANFDWITQNIEQIRKNHPDMFIAVDDGKVVAHGHDRHKVLDEVKQKYHGNYRKVAVKYVTTKALNLLL